MNFLKFKIFLLLIFGIQLSAFAQEKTGNLDSYSTGMAYGFLGVVAIGFLIFLYYSSSKYEMKMKPAVNILTQIDVLKAGLLRPVYNKLYYVLAVLVLLYFVIIILFLIH